MLSSMLRGHDSSSSTPTVRDRLRTAGRTLDHLLPTPVSRTLRDALGYHLPPPPVDMGDLRTTSPVSRNFGFDRGRPVDRHYIESFFEAHSEDVQGRVLEVEDDYYSQTYGGDQVAKQDILHVSPDFPDATITADLTVADHIPSHTFDCILLPQTLQYIYNPDAALRTLRGILKPEGVLLATVPGITPIADDIDGEAWYWSFTRHSLRRLAEEVFPTATTEVTSHGNALTATAFLQGMAVEDLTEAELNERDPNYEVTVTLRVEKSDTPLPG